MNSVDEYIAAQPEASQEVLQRVRAVICKALPGADEVISYQMPTYKLHGSAVIYFAGWKKHYSLYPATDTVLAAFREELAGYEINKHTIRFSLTQAVPAALIASIAKFRLGEMKFTARSKRTAKRAPELLD